MEILVFASAYAQAAGHKQEYIGFFSHGPRLIIPEKGATTSPTAETGIFIKYGR